MSRKCVWSGIAAACLAAAMCGGASAQIGDRPEATASRSADGLAVQLDALSLTQRRAKAWIRPKRHATARFDTAALRQTLSRAPVEGEFFARAAPEAITLLSPEGEWVEFGVYESPIMAAELQAKFPEIRTYAGAALNDPSTTVRLSMTPQGMAAQVLAPSDRWFLDRLNRDDDTLYASYRKSDARNPGAWGCQLIGELGMDLDPAAFEDLPPAQLNSGQTLRTYRTAVACTGEYAQFHGGTVNSALAAIVTAMNRVTGVYEREVAVRFVLVADNDQIIYTNGGTDPYSNNDGVAMLNQNISNLNSVLGSASYDVGHVFSTGGGGVAFLGVICTSSKAGGVTGLPSPIGDPFYVDYVAHEIGHQFGATHTFNSTTGSCAGGNRTGSTAYEVGSGTTIMGYAGICGSDNVQNNSDDYFHSASYDQIISYINGTGDTCGVDTATGNIAPSAEAGQGYTIPAQTPFALTASGSDPDGGSVTYCWEQRDLGPSTALGASDNGSSPLFRSFDPTSSPTRFFPSLADIVFNTNPDDEVLPSTNRSMTFRVTVRDNQPDGGGVAFDETTLNVTTSAGPFVVTSQSAPGQTFEGSLPVTWNVAGTDSGAIDCQTVDILLSTNGGQSFNLVLVEGTPNDGNESVILPVAANNARVMVRASDNVFFSIGSASFRTVPGDIAILLPEGVPGQTDPGVATSFPVEIVENASTLLPGSAQLVYGITGAADTAVSLSGGMDGLFTATLPAFQCDDDVVFFVRAEAESGAMAQTPDYGLEIGGVEVLFSDDFQTDNGWSSTSEGGVTAGGWERGVPVAGNRGDPSLDADGSGLCWLTQNDLGPSGDGNSDVDGGAVTLTSPVFDLSGGADFAYSYWLGDIAGGPLGGEDGFFVDVSTNGGTDWTRARDYGSAGTSWRQDSIGFGEGAEFAASANVRLRFIVADNSPGDVVEGGLDAIAISSFVCEDADPCLIADQTTSGSNPGDVGYGAPDGNVDIADLTFFVEQWLGGAALTDVTTSGSNPGDAGFGVPDGDVDVADLTYFVELWLGC